MKLKQLARFIPIIALVAIVLGTVIVSAPPPENIFPSFIDVFVTNTASDPVPVAIVDEPINVTVVGGSVTLPDDVEVNAQAATCIFLPMDNVSIPAHTSTVRFVNVDGYKTVNVWTRGIDDILTQIQVSWNFTEADVTFGGYAPNIAGLGESQKTYEVRAPMLKIRVKNLDTIPHYITIVVYAVS